MFIYEYISVLTWANEEQQQLILHLFLCMEFTVVFKYETIGMHWV